MTFEQFLAEINRLGREDGCDFDYVEQTGRECWADAFADGVSPTEAWATEKSYAYEC